VNPNSLMAAAICLTCLREWVRCVARIWLQLRHGAIGDGQNHGILLLSNRLKRSRRGGLTDQEWRERGPATCPKALPCKSFEPIGRHVRIVRVTLQDCRPGRLRGQPHETSRYRGPGLSLHLARGKLSTIVLETRSKLRTVRMVGMLHEQAFGVGISGSGASLIFCESSLLPDDDSLISQKNSLFTNAGNLSLSLDRSNRSQGQIRRTGHFWRKFPVNRSLSGNCGSRPVRM